MGARFEHYCRARDAGWLVERPLALVEQLVDSCLRQLPARGDLFDSPCTSCPGTPLVTLIEDRVAPASGTLTEALGNFARSRQIDPRHGREVRAFELYETEDRS